jgi:hypothetical protein
MQRLFLFFLFPLFAFLQSGSLLAEVGAAGGVAAGGTTSIQAVETVLQACPAPANQARIHLAQVAQTDCCKGHKGVCGCRAGKIVCCDKTISPTCTCHSDWHEAN